MRTQMHIMNSKDEMKIVSSLLHPEMAFVVLLSFMLAVTDEAFML